MIPPIVPGWTITLAHDGNTVATWAATPDEIALPGAHIINHLTGKAVSISDATYPVRRELRRAAEAQQTLI